MCKGVEIQTKYYSSTLKMTWPTVVLTYSMTCAIILKYYENTSNRLSSISSFSQG